MLNRTIKEMEKPMNRKKYWSEEIVRFATAPTYYIYLISILLTVVLSFLPDFNQACAAENAVPATVAAESARFFASELGMVLMFAPAFAIATACVRDKEKMKRNGSVLRDELKNADAVLIRAGSMLILIFLPLLIATTYADIRIAKQFGKDASFGASTCLTVTWLLPTVIFVTGFVLALTEWTKNCLPGIIAQLVVWVFTQGSTADYGDYTSCVAIRHAGFEGTAAVSSHAVALIINRLVVTVLGFAFIFAAIKGYEFHQKKTQRKQSK